MKKMMKMHQCRNWLISQCKRAAITGAAFAAVLGSEMDHVYAGPENPVVVNGNVFFDSAGNMHWIYASDGSIINYSSFNIGAGEHVYFVQPHANARVLNRIMSADPSMLNGSLSANGIVYFVNPAGIIFGPDSVINVGGIYAAAGHISNQDFAAGVDRFTNLTGTVSNFGALSADQVHLIGRHVQNHGVINANGGVLTMLAGNDVLIQPQGENIMIKVDGETITDQSVVYAGGSSPDLHGDPGVLNTGTINVQQGNVILGAGDLYSLAVNNTGIINANQGNVRIAATDGVINNSGQISVDAMNGTAGNISIHGPSVVNSGHLSANAHNGMAGSIDVTSQNHTYLLDGSSISASGLGASSYGGNVLVHSYGGLTVFADGSVIDVSGGSLAKGGFVEVSGLDVAFAGSVDLTGGTQNGTLLIDPLDIRVVEFGSDDSLINVDGEITFDIAPNEMVTISASALQAIVGSILLQAERDIYINHLVLLNGQNITLEAGRHIGINAPVIGANNFTAIADADLSGIGGPASDGIGLLNIQVALLQSAGKMTLSGGGGIKIHGDIRGEGIDLLSTVRFAGLQEHVIDAGSGHLFAANDLLMNHGGDLTLSGSSIDVDGNITVLDGPNGGFGTLRIIGPAKVEGNIFAAADAFFSDDVILDGSGDQSIMVGGLLQSSASIIKSSLAGDLLLDAGNLIDVAGNIQSNHGNLTVRGDALVGGNVDVAYEGVFEDTMTIDGRAMSKNGSLLFMDDAIVGTYVDAWNDVDFNGTADVGENVIAQNGHVNFDDDAVVGGNVMAATDITFDEDARVGGNVHAGGAIFIGDSADDFADIEGDIIAKSEGVHVISTLEVGGDIQGVGVELFGETIFDGAGNQMVDAGTGILLVDNTANKTTPGDLTLKGMLVDINVGIDVAGGSLIVDGPAELLGNVSAANTVMFTDTLQIEGDTMVTATDAVFEGAINSAPGTMHNLTIDAVNTSINGSVGENDILGTFHILDRNGTTTVVAELIHAKDVLLDSAVVLAGPMTTIRGENIVDFGSTVDGKSDLIVRGGTIHAGGDIGSNVQLASIDMQVTDPAGLIDFDGSIVHAHGDILLNAEGRDDGVQAATIIGRNDLTIESDNGMVRMGRGEKMTVDGDLAIIAATKALISDLNAAGQISVQSPSIEILLREAGTLYDANGNIITDMGVDFVAGNGMFFSTAPTVNGVGPAPLFFTPSGTGDLAGTLGAYDFGTTNQPGGGLALRLADGTILDLTGVLAGIGSPDGGQGLFPLIPDLFDIPQDLLTTIGEINRLRALGINARTLSEIERNEGLSGRAFSDDMDMSMDDGFIYPTFNHQRTTYGLTKDAYDTFERVMGDDPTVIYSSMTQAWNALLSSGLTAEQSAFAGGDGCAFRNFVMNADEMYDARAHLINLRTLLDRLKLIGLNQLEYIAARAYLLEQVRPDSMELNEFIKAVEGNCPSTHASAGPNAPSNGDPNAGGAGGPGGAGNGASAAGPSDGPDTAGLVSGTGYYAGQNASQNAGAGWNNSASATAPRAIMSIPAQCPADVSDLECPQ